MTELPMCQRCQKDLHGTDPLRRRLTIEEARRFTGHHQPQRPARVVRPGPHGTLQILYWCSSHHYKADHAKPEKKNKGKPTPDQQFHIRPQAA